MNFNLIKRILGRIRRKSSSSGVSPVVSEYPKIEGSKVIVSQNIIDLIEKLKEGDSLFFLTKEARRTLLALGVTIADLRDIEERQTWKEAADILVRAELEGRIVGPDKS